MELNVVTYETSFDKYFTFLEEFNEWKISKRDINLCFLLHKDNKIQFDLEIRPPIAIYMKLSQLYEWSQKVKIDGDTYQPGGIWIEKITFILKDNKVKDLKVEVTKQAQSLVDDLIGNEEIKSFFLENGGLRFYIKKKES